MCIICAHDSMIFKIELVMANKWEKLTISDKLNVISKVGAIQTFRTLIR
jgi:hypothetical protein